MNPLIDTITAKTSGRVRSYLASRDAWNISRSLKSLIEQAIRDYEHRALLELLQNAHDAHPRDRGDGRILIRLNHDEGKHGTLIVANGGQPFTMSNFDAICDIAQSDKRADEGIGNKGIGFKSCLQLCRIPEVYSVSCPSSQAFDGFCFRFADEDDIRKLAAGQEDFADLIKDVFHLCLPIPLDSIPESVRDLAAEGYVTAVRLPLKSELAREEAQRELRGLEEDPPALLFLRRISSLVMEERGAVAGKTRNAVHVRVEHSIERRQSGMSVNEVDLGNAGRFIVAERIVDPAAFKAAIMESIGADRISEAWRDWSGEASVGLAVRLGEPLEHGRLYTFLPMGEDANAPFPGHVNAPFFAKLARIDFEESVPLNDFLLDEIARLCATVVILASREQLALSAPIVADLLCWSEPNHKRLVRAFDREGHALSSAKVIPVQGSHTKYCSLDSVHYWEDSSKRIFTSANLVRAGARLVHGSIDGVRLKRLNALTRLLTGGDLRPPDSRVSKWAESFAESAAKRSFNARWWEAFYDELAAVVRDPASLRGLRILIDDEDRLQVCLSADHKGPTPFFPPGAEGSVNADVDLRIPRTLKRQIFFMNQKLRWTQKVGQTLVRTPGRQMLETGGLVRDYGASEVFAVIKRAMANNPTPARSLDALEWIYRFAQSREEPPWKEISSVGFRVPTSSGWIAAHSALFSSEWGGAEDILLNEFISHAASTSSEIDALSKRLLVPPKKWPFPIVDVSTFRTFLDHLGVRTGLWPHELPDSVISNNGRAFEDKTAGYAVPMSVSTRGLWQRSLDQRETRGLRPMTRYRADGPLHRLPGQDDYERFTTPARRAYAQLIVLGLQRWKQGTLEVTCRRYNDREDSSLWPTPLYAFLEWTDWLPMSKAGERNVWHFVAPADAWSYDGEDSPPVFAPLLPHAIRRIAEANKRSQDRLRKFGVQYWDAPETANARVRFLAKLFCEGLVPETTIATFKRAYEQAWSDVIQQGTGDPFAGSADTQLLVTRKGRLESVSLAEGRNLDRRIYVQDVEASQSLRLLEQRGAPILRLHHSVGSAVFVLLSDYLGSSVQLVSQTKVLIRADGIELAPSGAGQLLVAPNRDWLAKLIAALVERRAGSFRRSSQDAIRRVTETLHRIRIVFAQSLETLVDGEVVANNTRVLSLADPATPTIVIAFDDASDDVALLQSISPAVAELIGYPELADSLRLGLVDLQRGGWFDDQPPTLAAVAEVIGESEQRLHEITNSTKQQVLDLARILIPILSSLDAEAGEDLAQNIETFADAPAVAAWLESSGYELPVQGKVIVDACRGEDLNAARVALGIPLRALNSVLRRMGTHEPLRNEEGIEHAFRYFITSYREQILASLRTRFLAAYQSNLSLDEYVSRRNFTALAVDPAWPEDYYDIDEAVIRTRVNAWLSEVQAPPLGGAVAKLVAIDEIRRSNRTALASLIAAATDAVSAWERKHGREPSGLPGESGPIVDLAADTGRLDFEPLVEGNSLAWLGMNNRWPDGMPATLNAVELGISKADIEAAASVRAAEARRQRDETRQIVIDGKKTSADPTNYAAIAASIRAGLSADFLATPASVTQLATLSTPLSPLYPGRGGVTAVRRPRLSDAQAAAVGLAGEVAALEWLKARYAGVTDAAWRSGYRNVLLGGNEGDDSLGYDFEIFVRSNRILFEVKASPGESFEFDLTPTEIRAAQTIRRRDRYHILFVTNVLQSETRKVLMLPNPFGNDGFGLYRTAGSGLRLKFLPK